ncbi:MAG TPA: GGDEF domain-containing protein [Terriglobales bacterium]|nr:GGDEF domain-containing protein [Terriglobales bacterium]
MDQPQPSYGPPGQEAPISKAPDEVHAGEHADEYRPLPNRSGHEDLPAVLLAKHNELDRLLEELNEISKALKSKDSPDIQGLSESLMRAVRSAVRQSLLDRELCSLALIDDLTGLNNRRGFLALAAQELKHGHRNLQEFLLFSIDLDRLKMINDTYGHQEGDCALLRTANALRGTFRNSDILSRFGGDEFCVLAPEASIENERTIIDRLKENLRHASADEPRYPLTVSIGTARFNPRHPVSLDQLMDESDQAMYRCKRSRELAPTGAAVSR